MNKTELVKSISKKTKLTQRDCSMCLDALKEVVAETLTHGETIVLSGFGRFFTRFKPQRKGINPITRDYTIYPSKYVPSFSPSAILKAKFR